MLDESTYIQLLHSAIEAFPTTEKRQYSIDTVRIVGMHWTPFPGMKTLFASAIAENHRGGGGSYKVAILLKEINYHHEPNSLTLSLAANDGKVYYAESANSDVLVRCACNDMKYRFSYYNSKAKAHYGRLPPKYERVPGSNRPPANPLQLEGMCKHLMVFFKSLQETGIVS